MAKDIGRNDPCPCGSGKKYKKCCGVTPQVKQRTYSQVKEMSSKATLTWVTKVLSKSLRETHPESQEKLDKILKKKEEQDNDLDSKS